MWIQKDAMIDMTERLFCTTSHLVTEFLEMKSTTFSELLSDRILTRVFIRLETDKKPARKCVIGVFALGQYQSSFSPEPIQTSPHSYVVTLYSCIGCRS